VPAQNLPAQLRRSVAVGFKPTTEGRHINSIMQAPAKCNHPRIWSDLKRAIWILNPGSWLTTFQQIQFQILRFFSCCGEARSLPTAQKIYLALFQDSFHLARESQMGSLWTPRLAAKHWCIHRLNVSRFMIYLNSFQMFEAISTYLNHPSPWDRCFSCSLDNISPHQQLPGSKSFSLFYHHFPGRSHLYPDRHIMRV